jgi:diguanylate cyclase (GGDEF)-like protein
LADAGLDDQAMYTSVEFVLLAVFFAITILNAISMIYVWRLHYHEDATRLWVISNFLAAIAAVAYLVRPLVPEALSILTGYLAGVSGVFIYTFGIAKFLKAPPPYRLGAFVTILVFIITSVFIALGLASKWRYAVFASSIILGNLSALYLLLRPVTKVDGRARFVVAVVSVTFAIGWIVNLMGELPEIFPVISYDGAQITWLSVNIIASALLPMSLLLMVSERLLQRLDIQARFDELTGALNRRAFLERAHEESARALRHGLDTALLLVDLDNFKLINDRYGHKAGDEALRHFAQITNGLLRTEDLFGRIGGDEFCFLLPETPLAEAIIVADRLREFVAKSEIVIGSQKIAMTISIGAISVDFRTVDALSAIAAADALLYEAKHGGRNRVAS